VLLVSTITVLAGTVFPLITDALQLGKYSVGPPYFNAVFVPLMGFLIAFMGVGPLTHWKSTRWEVLRGHLLAVVIATLVSTGILAFAALQRIDAWSVLALLFALWLVAGVLIDLRNKLRHAPSLSRGFQRLTASYYGMQIGHIGFALTVIGVCLVSQFSVEKDIRMAPGESASIGEYRFQFEGSRAMTGPNFSGTEGIMRVFDGEREIAELHPQKRRYHATGQVMTEAAIDPGLWRDIYVAMGDALDEGAWAVRLHYKPMVRFIWLGALIMAAGGLLAIVDKRYKLKVKTSKAPANSSVEAV
jgi:cytochrome c-type biogenesis protein CcmF